MKLWSQKKDISPLADLAPQYPLWEKRSAIAHVAFQRADEIKQAHIQAGTPLNQRQIVDEKQKQMDAIIKDPEKLEAAIAAYRACGNYEADKKALRSNYCSYTRNTMIYQALSRYFALMAGCIIFLLISACYVAIANSSFVKPIKNAITLYNTTMKKGRQSASLVKQLFTHRSTGLCRRIQKVQFAEKQEPFCS